MEIPEGLDAPNDRREYFCKLAKSLYGLKQASRCWSQTLTRLLAKHDLKPCNADASVYTGTVDGEIVILVLFVDDGLVLAKSRVALNSLIDILRSNFEITMSDPDVFVGVQIERDENTRNMFIHQGLYTHSVLKRFKMLDSNPVCTLMDTGVDLSVSEGESEMNERMPFRELIGSLMFLANVTRPDISFAVNVLSRFLNNYSESHWQAAKRILRYLRGTIEYGIMYVCDKEAVTLSCYSDADYAGDVSTRRSTTGYIFKMCDGPVSWCAQRQRTVSLSTTEAEYVAAGSASREVVWLRRLLEEVECLCSGPTVLNVDNQSAIRLIKNPEFHKRTKHIDIQHHYVRELYESGEISVSYVSSEEQLADLFTKPLPRCTYERLRGAIGMCEKPKD